MTEIIILFAASFIAGVFNAVAGGGGFITFSALAFSGVNPVAASAISTVALWPGNLASAKAFQNEIINSKIEIKKLLFLGATGGAVGAFLLSLISIESFRYLVPYFLIVALLFFVFAAKIQRLFNFRHLSKCKSASAVITITLMQIVLSVYGGFFGAGLGIMFLSLFISFGYSDLNELNGIKVLYVSVTNGTAAVLFIIKDIIIWDKCLLMLLGSILGGFYGAKYSLRLRPCILKTAIIIIGIATTIYFIIY
ncbi:MAG: sulfite exporter TauE/SafE family protein [Sediminibacterium magnilacihabitans]|jgi:uncharacterized membrane protein YfcA|nr:sulfite exporter TauE/SafE family protein [Sediminibacterium magnilacihabitans]PQV62110.1 hypothetical protein CLV53_101385 [Sediminibacterium magnilacihabitans]